jgi:hypothetical protein
VVRYAVVCNGDATGSPFNPERREALWVDVVLGLLLATRVARNFGGDSGSRLPEDGPAWAQRLASLTHGTIYGLLAYGLNRGNPCPEGVRCP